MELILDQVTKQYEKKPACHCISLTLRQGIYGLLGANGAGKTTLMRMLCGVLAPTSGTIRFNTLDVSHEDYRDALGYLPQDFGYYPEFSALEFLLYMAALKGLPKPRAEKRSWELLEEVSLTPAAKQKIKTFSGGMKQRLGIAQSLLNDPRLLILDEPTAGLDPKERVRFRNLISRLGTERIILLSTHIVSDVEHIAGTILIMKEGRLLHQGTRDQIIATMGGKVWECTRPQAEADALCREYPVINLRQESSGEMLLRLIADGQPPAGARNVPATLEDVYLYYFREVNEQ